MNERAVLRARELLTRAPLQPELWLSVLEAIGAATGSKGVQLIGVGGGEMITNVCVGIPEAAFEAWAAAGGADPSVNPYMRSSQTAPLMTVIHVDQDEIVRARGRTSKLNEVLAAHDIPHQCYVMLRRDGDERLSLCLYRSEVEGRLPLEAENLFVSLLPAVTAALDIQQRLNSQASEAARAALDAMGQAAMVCDAFGRVIAISSAGSRLAESGVPVAIRRDRLVFTAPSLLRSGPAALTAATVARAPLPSPQYLVAPEPPGYTVEIHALPYRHVDHGSAPACLVLIKTDQEGRTPLDEEGALTVAERAVATRLLAGDKTKQIAEDRGVSVETVRGQIKSIYAKLHVGGRNEFMARFR